MNPLTVLGDHVMTEAQLRNEERSKLAPRALREVLLARALVPHISGKGVKNDPKLYRRNAGASSFHSGAGTRKNTGAENSGSGFSKKKNAEEHFSQDGNGASSGTTNSNGHVVESIGLTDEDAFASLATAGPPEVDE